MNTEFQLARTKAVNVNHFKRANSIVQSNDKVLSQFSALVFESNLTKDSLAKLKEYNAFFSNKENMYNAIAHAAEEKKKSLHLVNHDYEGIFNICKANVIGLINRNIMHNDEATTGLKRFFGRLLTVISSIAIVPIGYMVYKHVKYGNGWFMFGCKTQDKCQTVMNHVNQLALR